jgi:glycosyltransferase involved in cell wall biosynthesis
MTPLVSVVTPSYNQGKYIKATIDSVLGQDYPHVEYLVIDGGSTDETVEILRQYPDSRLQWVSEPDNGQSSAINKGLQRATGGILTYLNSDDVFLPDATSCVVNYFEAHPDVDMLYGDCLTIDLYGKEIQPPLMGQPFNLVLLFTTRLDIPQPTVFWRRRVMERIGLFDESLHYTMDYDYWLRMAAAECKLVYVPGCRAAFRTHHESKTGTENLGFWQDWETIMRKIFARPDLPQQIQALKRDAFAYVNLYGATLLWSMGRQKDSRPLLRQMIRQGTWRPRVLGVVMWIDSYLHTPLTKLLRVAYSKTIGNRFA